MLVDTKVYWWAALTVLLKVGATVVMKAGRSGHQKAEVTDELMVGMKADTKVVWKAAKMVERVPMWVE